MWALHVLALFAGLLAGFCSGAMFIVGVTNGSPYRQYLLAATFGTAAFLLLRYALAVLL